MVTLSAVNVPMTLALTISIVFWSWILGRLLNELLRKRSDYQQLAHWVFLPGNRLNRWIGLGIFKWIVVHTFFRYLNQKLTLPGRPSREALEAVREEMVYSEISHLIGFGLVGVAVLVNVLCFEHPALTWSLLVTNVFMNLYPALLQQQNKRRLIAALSATKA
ncbi:hypothetical protein SAMN05421823_11621 [Catalinimonas alkaloidigena]|uniref:Glycosyl-4,4'-diaponeurosporenoate acyltransferase n=2 Tax=Catalinimonas alkaloidigena TaxID=1075417 RepID=A0A1G9UC25_9BACT|nr:hypothetical protein SAMN05421823_11621 [Catalinimonas alkaloidigena]